jgi:hypothetical protein
VSLTLAAPPRHPREGEGVVESLWKLLPELKNPISKFSTKLFRTFFPKSVPGCISEKQGFAMSFTQRAVGWNHRRSSWFRSGISYNRTGRSTPSLKHSTRGGFDDNIGFTFRIGLASNRAAR